MHVCIQTHTQHPYGGLAFCLYINSLASSSWDLKYICTSGGSLAQSLFKAESSISSRFANGWKNLHFTSSYRFYRSCLPSFCAQALKERNQTLEYLCSQMSHSTQGLMYSSQCLEMQHLQANLKFPKFHFDSSSLGLLFLFARICLLKCWGFMHWWQRKFSELLEENCRQWQQSWELVAFWPSRT